MSPFVGKDWKDANSFAGGGDTSTPLSAAALEDLETRLSGYTDDETTDKVSKTADDTVTGNPTFDPTGGNGSVTAEQIVNRALIRSKNLLDYGADPTGVADSTTAFNNFLAAVGANGNGEIPEGTFLIGDVREATVGSTYKPTIRGTGNGTILKAKAGATRVLDFRGTTAQPLWQVAIEDLVIDGNADASEGSRFYATDPGSCQQQFFKRVVWQNCSKGHHVSGGAASENQSDKNTYLACRWVECDTGLHIDSNNAQNQRLENCEFTTTDLGILLSHGTLYMAGGGYAHPGVTGDAFIRCDGGNIGWIHLEDVITESVGSFTDIDCTGQFWPTYGVSLEHCVLQGDGGIVFENTAGGGPGVFTADQCHFNGSSINATGDDCTFADEFCVFGGGAVWNPTGATNRRYHRDLSESYAEVDGLGKTSIAYDGVDFNDGDATLSSPAANYLDTQGTFRAGGGGGNHGFWINNNDGFFIFRGDQTVILYSPAANVLALDTGDALRLGSATGTGQYLEMWEQTADPAAPSANSGRLFLKDNGSGKTQACIRFASGDIQIIAEEP